jgi:hypothetical protein
MSDTVEQTLLNRLSDLERRLEAAETSAARAAARGRSCRYLPVGLLLAMDLHLGQHCKLAGDPSGQRRVVLGSARCQAARNSASASSRSEGLIHAAAGPAGQPS